MSLEASIQARWAERAELIARVPVARVFSGAAQGEPALPYVVLSRQGERIVARTSSGVRLAEIRLRFQVLAVALSEVKETLAAVRGAFERSELELDAGRCVNLQALGGDERLGTDGVWEGVADYQALVAES